MKLISGSSSLRTPHHTGVLLGATALALAAGGAYGLSHHHGARIGDQPAKLACGHAFASGPVPIYMDTKLKAEVPRHGQFTLVVTRNCKASTHVVAASGVTILHGFQGKDFAYDVRLQRRQATLTIAVDGTDRRLVLVGANPAPPSSSRA